MARGLLVLLAFAAILAQTQEALKAAAASREDTSKKVIDCSIVAAFLGDGAPVARRYPMPPIPPEGAGIWEQPPYVMGAARCGNLYIFQVSSRSKDAWVVQQARVEGPNGQILHVNALSNKVRRDHWVFNVLVAEAPPGVTLPQLRLTLASADGRATQIDARDLP